MQQAQSFPIFYPVKDWYISYGLSGRVNKSQNFLIYFRKTSLVKIFFKNCQAKLEMSYCYRNRSVWF